MAMTAVWMCKKCPEPFFGPDDYIEGYAIIDQISDHEKAIFEWTLRYRSLSLWDKIRLFFSDYGCYVNVRGT